MFDLQCPPDWRVVTLSDLGEVNRGRSRHRPRYAAHLYGGKYPFIQTGDIKASGGRITHHTQTYSEAGLAQSRLWPAGTMCITIAANIAETALLTYPACFPDSVIGFIADPAKGADVRFVEYVFRYLRGRIQGVTAKSGTAQDNINLEFLERLRFPVPRSLPEQRAIAGVLGALDDKIEVNRKTARVLEGIARAVFTSWFVDFDPVRANIRRREHAALGRAGRFISTGDDISISDPSGKVIHRAGDAAQGPIAHLFPDRLVDSAIGEVPEGWRVGTLGEVIEAVGGGTPSTGEPSYWDGGTHAFCTPKDMSALTAPVLLTTERRVTDAGLGKINSGLLPSGTVVMSSRAPIGYLAITEIPVAVNQGIIAMRCTRGWPASFVLRWCEAHMDQIEANANGSTFQEISKTNFRPIAAVLPDPAVVSAFDRVAAPLHRRVVACERQSATLAALRDALLPKLISGELRIADAERIVGRAV